jgi:glutamyl-tRNA synthetase
MTVRTRFAPSPTGFLHIGGLRTALVFLALRTPPCGVFVLAHRGYRPRAVHPEAIQQILDGLEWAGST